MCAGTEEEEGKLFESVVWRFFFTLNTQWGEAYTNPRQWAVCCSGARSDIKACTLNKHVDRSRRGVCQ